MPTFPLISEVRIKREDYPVEFLEPKSSFGEGIDKALRKVGNLLGEERFKVKKAIKVAQKRQPQFYENSKNKGKEVLNSLGKKGL